jgi:hypothetical protein
VAKIVLANSKVRLSSPRLFNDPFDCYFSLEPKFDLAACKDEHRERFVDLVFQEEEPAFASGNFLVPQIQAFRGVAQTKSRAELARVFDEVYPQMVKNLEALSQLEREIWERESGDYRLFCVCEINDNLLLWSHYTVYHTGAAFQFECIEELDVPLLAALPVRYTDEAPALATKQEWIEFGLGLRGADDSDVWTRLVTTKARCWEHEKEWRVITKRRGYENEGFEDCKFYPREISKVYLGCRMSQQDRQDILHLLTGPFGHVEAYQAKQNPRMYRLDFERVR